MIPELNWAGFYLVDVGKLSLGPYQGKVACTPIPFGKGVCGKVALSGKTELIMNVNNFTGHIACDSASQSELVVPVKADKKGANF